MGFFGGMVDFSDSDAIDVDYSKPPNGDAFNSHSTDAQWTYFQKCLSELKPVVLESEVG